MTKEAPTDPVAVAEVESTKTVQLTAEQQRLIKGELDLILRNYDSGFTSQYLTIANETWRALTGSDHPSFQQSLSTAKLLRI